VLRIFSAVFSFFYLAQSSSSVLFLDGAEENLFFDVYYVRDVFLTAFDNESELLFNDELFDIERLSKKQQFGSLWTSPKADFSIPSINDAALILKDPKEIKRHYNFPMKKLQFNAAHPKLRTNLKMGFNAVDLALGKNLFATRHLAFQACAGAKTAWTDYRNQVQYWSVFQPITNEPAEPMESLMRNKWLEIGPRIGIDGRCRIGRSGMALQTNAAACLLLNHSGLNSQLNSFIPLNEGASEILRPVAEIYFGFDWNCPSSRWPGCFNVTAGYEVQYWWDRVASLKYVKLDPNADLKFQGFLIKARASF